MSLLGVDIGSSAVKAAAYREAGALLAQARETAPSHYSPGGFVESDVDEVWDATVKAIRRVTGSPKVRRDPPTAVAISASGRESFPARGDGSALGPCLRTMDARSPSTQASAIIQHTAEDWVAGCGHVPDHMDPTNRLLWWRETSPSLLAGARWFLGWHELASLKLVGRPVIDPALAAGFLLFDLGTKAWSAERTDALKLDLRLLPDIVPWATPLGPVNPRMARRLGLPKSCKFVVGSWDGSCAAVGAAVVDEGSALLAAGTWESTVAPVKTPRLREAARLRLAVTPEPSTPGLGVWARSPNGMSAIEWAKNLVGLTFDELESGLLKSGTDAATTLLVPHLSGVPGPWPAGRRPGGALFGLTLSSSKIDVVKAMMEGIAFELTFAFSALRQAGADIKVCRVSGGGTRFSWWMQLKADLLGIPVEVPSHLEPGTLGAALLAGLGSGAYRSLAEAAERVTIARRFEPNVKRAASMLSKLERHRGAVERLTSLS